MQNSYGRRIWRFATAGLLVTCLGIGPALVVDSQPAAAVPAGTLHGGGSIDEAWLTGAAPGDSVTLVQNGSPVSNAGNPGTADGLGALIIRDLTAGDGYAWHDTTTDSSSAMASSRR